MCLGGGTTKCKEFMGVGGLEKNEFISENCVASEAHFFFFFFWGGGGGVVNEAFGTGVGKSAGFPENIGRI